MAHQSGPDVDRTGYAEAGLIAPLSAYHHGWALRHGAQATKLVQVPADVIAAWQASHDSP